MLGKIKIKSEKGEKILNRWEHINHLIKVNNALNAGARIHYEKIGLTYVDVPQIVGITGACENVDTLFKIGNRLGLPLFMTQTGQLSLEQALQTLPGVYTVIHSGRDEEVEDERHLRQFRLTEEEFDCTMEKMTRKNYDEEKMYEALLCHIEQAVKSMISQVVKDTGFELQEIYGRKTKDLLHIVSQPFGRITYEDAVKLLQKNGHPKLTFGDDLKAEHEQKIVELVNKSSSVIPAKAGIHSNRNYIDSRLHGNDNVALSSYSPVFIMRYPKEIKFFNMKVSQTDERVVLSADLIFPYAGEGTGAAVREHNGEKLKERLLTSTMFKLHQERGGKYEDFAWYLEDMVMAGKTNPHAGYGIGNDRVAQFFLGQPDIRTSSLFSQMSTFTGDWDTVRRGLIYFYENKKRILFSIGKTENKKKLLPAIKKIHNANFMFYATEKTHKFLAEHKIDGTLVYKVSQIGKKPNLQDLLHQNFFDIIVNIPTGRKRRNNEFTDGKLIRKLATDLGVTIVTDADVATTLLDKLYKNELEEKTKLQREVFRKPFYDYQKTYEENYKDGPFGAFKEKPPIIPVVKEQDTFLDFKVNLSLGIPAGPILNSNFVKAAFEWGFDIVHYKTVRSTVFPSHPWPNIKFVKVDGDLTPDKFNHPLIAYNETNDSPLHFNITNSFGVPSQSPDVWQPDVKKALSYQKDGQLLVLSFMGTKKEGFNERDYIKDFGITAKLAKETGVSVLEVNLSCPNMGKEGLICYDINRSREICEEIKNKIGNTPLLVKIGYYTKNQQPLLEKLVKYISPYINGISAINTIQMDIIDQNGKQALPGAGRLRSGVCGAGIFWAGIDMVKRLNKIRMGNNYDFIIIGVGGVMTPEDYLSYKDTGADVVQSATGAMWNPYLAQQIKATLNK